ncbi:hypothetical protein BD560DRAFT_405946 [Blakeslea trispora]|nr:hypothetical protein BD560DRAFT_405946 [Blakeslea trispora]
MSGRNPKGAALSQSHFESPEVVDCFLDLVDPLVDELGSVPRDIVLTARDLSLLIGQLQQFQQDCLGAFNRPTHAPVRIPAKLLKVSGKQKLTTASPIYQILLSAYSFRLKHGWKKWDFTNPTKKQKNADLVQFIRTVLIKCNLIHVPKIAVADSVDDTVKKTVMSLAKKMGATFVENKSEATHILHGQLYEYSKEGIEEDWFRTLEKDGNMVLVHWWYYPDSFDSWLIQTKQFADPEEPPEHTGPWCLNVRWLQDTERFNEYMNEEDYEDLEEEEEEEDEEEEEESVPNTPRKRKLSESALDQPQPMISFKEPLIAASMQRQQQQHQQHQQQQQQQQNHHHQQLIDTEPDTYSTPIHNPGHQPIVRIRDIELEKPQVGSRQRKNEFEPYLNGDMTNISQYTVAYVEHPQPFSKRHVEGETTNQLDIASLVTAAPYPSNQEQTGPDWFNMDQIHTIERLALPEYFDGTLSSKGYKHCRNEMIKMYRAHPDYYLTVLACKTKLEKDLVELVRIHSFLESNQLINHQWDPRRRIFDPIIDTEPYAQANPHSQRNFREVEEASIEHLRSLIYSESHVPQRPSLWDMTDREDDTLNPDNRKMFHCSNCKADCSEVRYQSLKTKGFQVCIDCFVEGRFPAIYASNDFLRIEGLADLSMDEEWTDEEILRLLEGVDRFEDDWLLISEHVGSRSKEQCVTQFLQLPMTDEFLKAKLSTKEREALPFSQQPNPVMTTIAFLAGHINPGVGAAAAKTALKELVKSGEGHEEDLIKEEQKEMTLEEESPSVFSKETLKQAQIAAIKSAVENARKLASYEDQEIQHWTRLAVKTMVDKLLFKVQQYDELENSLMTELQELEKQQGVLATSIEALCSQRFPSAQDSIMTDNTN